MEEIECLKYLYINFSMQKKTLKNIVNDYNLKDELYELIYNEIRVYTRFMISLKYMIKNRSKKNKELISNNVVGAFAGIQNRVIENKNKSEIVKYVKEATKINILDIKRVKKDYKIKSKTILNLLDRIMNFERSNLENIKNLKNIPKNVN